MSIYALKDPRDGRVRYVGMSRRLEERRQCHLSGPDHGKKVHAWVQELREIDAEPTMEILRGGSEAEWIERLKPDLNVHRGNSDANHRNARFNVITLELSDDDWADTVDAAKACGIDAFVYARDAIVKAARAELRKAGKTPATG